MVFFSKKNNFPIENYYPILSIGVAMTKDVLLKTVHSTSAVIIKIKRNLLMSWASKKWEHACQHILLRLFVRWTTYSTLIHGRDLLRFP